MRLVAWILPISIILIPIPYFSISTALEFQDAIKIYRKSLSEVIELNKSNCFDPQGKAPDNAVGSE